MKFNWGTGIVLFFIFFAASMTYAVVATTHYPPQLMQKDYYALDIHYQERLERKQNTAALLSAPQVGFDAAQQSIRVTLPEGAVAQTGTVKCYRSATTRSDFTTPLTNTSSLNIPTGQLAPGRWHVELEWESAEGKKFFWEQALVVNG